MTESDTQGNLTSDPDTVTHTSNRPYTVTHTSNGIFDQTLLSVRTIGKVSVLPPPMNPTVRLMPQRLLAPAAKEIFANAMLVNVWTSRTLWKISKTGVDGSIPTSTPIHIGMSKYSTPTYSDISGTRCTRNRISVRDTSQHCGLNVSLEICHIRESTTPDLRKSNKLDTSIDNQSTNNLVAPPIFTEVIC